MPPAGGYQDDVAGVQGLNPEFRDRAFIMRELVYVETGIVMNVGDGFRPRELQIQRRIENCGGNTYYNIWVKPPGDCNPATAKPGTSDHEHTLPDGTPDGIAIDWTVHYTRHPFILAAANIVGLVYNVNREPWHVVPGWRVGKAMPNVDHLRHLIEPQPTQPARKVAKKMIDSCTRSNGQGLRALLNHDGKPFFSFQQGSPGNWGAFSPRFAVPLFGGGFNGVSPEGDPGVFDNISICVNDYDQATVTAFFWALGGPDTELWSTWELGLGVYQFSEWVRIG